MSNKVHPDWWKDISELEALKQLGEFGYVTGREDVVYLLKHLELVSTPPNAPSGEYGTLTPVGRIRLLQLEAQKRLDDICVFT
jgi:hypothetical protein